MTKPLSIDAIELDDGMSLAELKASFGIEEKPIDTALRRLHAWALVAIGGSVNMVRVDDVLYIWDLAPRRLQNGALQGRVHMQRRGEVLRDIGGYKIDARGRVLQIPPELAGVLPGAAGADTEETP